MGIKEPEDWYFEWFWQRSAYCEDIYPSGQKICRKWEENRRKVFSCLT